MKKQKYFKRFIAYLLISLFILSCAAKNSNVEQQVITPDTAVKFLRVGFDVDDTLLFSTPAFDKAKTEFEWNTTEFWSLVNSLDADVSIVKESVEKILFAHQEAGDEIYVITARKPDGGEKLKEFLEEYFDISSDNVFFEPSNKIDRIKELKLDFYYGDSDSDIKDAMDAGSVGIRILRSPNSSYKDEITGKLKNYNPGIYNEKIIENTEE